MKLFLPFRISACLNLTSVLEGRNMNSKSKLPFFAVVLLIVSAVDSNRNLPSAAIFGSPLIFFFLFSAFFFLFPVSMVSAELGAASATKGGIYHWVRLAFGEKPGVIADVYKRQQSLKDLCFE